MSPASTVKVVDSLVRVDILTTYTTSHLPGGKINAPGAMLRTRAPVALLEPARGEEASGRKTCVKLAITKRCTATDGASGPSGGATLQRTSTFTQVINIPERPRLALKEDLLTCWPAPVDTADGAERGPR